MLQPLELARPQIAAADIGTAAANILLEASRPPLLSSAAGQSAADAARAIARVLGER
jgi:hypothetical protein